MSSVFDGLAAIFTGALGEEVILRPAGSADVTVRAVVVRPSQIDLGVVQRRPAIHARSADVESLGDGDEVEIGGAVFVARTFLPDGRGMTTVELEAAA